MSRKRRKRRHRPQPIRISGGVTLIAYPREEPDLDQFVQALIAMAVDQLTIEKRQAAVLRGEIKLLPESTQPDKS